MSLWRYLLHGGTSPDLSPLDVYTRVLATADDGLRRSHRRTQTAKPRQARLWLAKARRLRAIEPIVHHDERYGRTA